MTFDFAELIRDMHKTKAVLNAIPKNHAFTMGELAQLEKVRSAASTLAWAAEAIFEDLQKGKPPHRKTICVMQNAQDADWEANRDLIIAAPALLAACKAAMTLVATMQGMPPSGDLITSVRERLEDAVAKAEGPNPTEDNA